MINYHTKIEELNKRGYRITNIREAILRIFFSSHGPWSTQEIIEKLKKENLSPNKTTIYREIDFLISENIITEINFGEGMKKYELYNSNDHHHHLFCTSCHKVEKIELDEDFLHEQEEKISSDKKFKINSHALEFFGICNKCQKKG